jgi:hypothetical protein
MRSKANRKARTGKRRSSPADYRQFAADSVRRCFALPINRKRSREVQLILAKAWAKLADQAEDWRKAHPPSAAA